MDFFFRSVAKKNITLLRETNCCGGNRFAPLGPAVVESFVVAVAAVVPPHFTMEVKFLSLLLLMEESNDTRRNSIFQRGRKAAAEGRWKMEKVMWWSTEEEE